MYMTQNLIEEVMTKGNSQDIYESLNNADPSVVVMKIYEQIKSKEWSKICKREKCSVKSEMFSMRGYENFKNKQYGNALKLYNTALLFAPPNTEYMRVVYRNRSLLLFECRQYEETLKDIEKCFELGGLKTKTRKELEKRRKLCKAFLLNNSIEESSDLEQVIDFFQSDIFNMDSEQHLEIPGVSTAVSISTDSTSPRVLAAVDIHPGTVVAIETGFVTTTTSTVFELSCYYCQKLTLNLIPCNNCCVALFCDDICREQCLLEYHGIECNIANTDYDETMSLVLKAIIKIRNKCADWNEFVHMSHSIGKASLKINIYDAFSSNSKSSLLSDANFTNSYGKNFTSAWKSAMIIRHLNESSLFFPEDYEEWQNVVTAAAKQMMCLFSQSVVNLKLVAKDISTERLAYSDSQLGYFSFMGKLKHSCDPNVEMVSSGSKVFLMAIRPIKRGDELRRCYIEREKKERDMLLFNCNVLHYDCHACAQRNIKQGVHLTDEQLILLRVCQLADKDDMYPMLCNVIAAFDNLRYTEFYYEEVYDRFMIIIFYNQNCQTKNKILDTSYVLGTKFSILTLKKA